MSYFYTYCEHILLNKLASLNSVLDSIPFSTLEQSDVAILGQGYGNDLMWDTSILTAYAQSPSHQLRRETVSFFVKHHYLISTTGLPPRTSFQLNHSTWYM
jgi:hypothetical protein